MAAKVIWVYFFGWYLEFGYPIMKILMQESQDIENIQHKDFFSLY